jgi:hypothetical protein
MASAAPFEVIIVVTVMISGAMALFRRVYPATCFLPCNRNPLFLTQKQDEEGNATTYAPSLGHATV